MIEAVESSVVRAAEEPLLAQGVPLMDQAACALATVVLRELREVPGRLERGAGRESRVAGPPGVRGRRAVGHRVVGHRSVVHRAAGHRVVGRRVVALVGPGNNGADTLYAAARLADRGLRVQVVLAGDRVHEGALAALRTAGGAVVAVGEPSGPGPQRGPGGATLVPAADAVALALAADVVLDGLLGIGGRAGLRGAARDVVTALGAATEALKRPRRPLVVAVDVPSGIGVDDGTLPDPAVLRADVTVTFGAPKPGLLLPPASGRAGRVEVVDLALRLPARAAVQRLTGADLVRRGVLAAPAVSAHKYTRGVLGVVAGTQQFPGAAVLTVSGALRSGAAMVRYLGSREVTAAVLAARPEAVPAAGRVQAWALGPGISAAPPAADEATRAQHARIRHALAQVTGLLASDVVGDVVPAVVDAGAIALLPTTCPPWVVLTPHAGELAELLRSRGERVERGDVEAAPLAWARRARDLTGATVLLKGATTVVVGPGVVYAQADGPSWLATAGAGDVLTGLLGALLAAHSAAAVKEPALPALLAASAALLHGRAAHRANPGGPVVALDVAGALGATIAELLG